MGLFYACIAIIPFVVCSMGTSKSVTIDSLCGDRTLMYGTRERRGGKDGRDGRSNG